MDNLIGYDTPFFVSDVDSGSLRIGSTHLNGGRLFCYEGNATVTLNGATKARNAPFLPSIIR